MQLVKIKNLVPEVLAQTSYEIVLDLGKIQTLKNGKWIRVEEGEPLVDEEELLKSLREKSRVSLKNISRNEIIKKDCLSSSSEDSAFFDDDEFKLIAKLALSSSASKALERNS